jgi:alcohol dehydrogenase (NADP+)
MIPEIGIGTNLQLYKSEKIDDLLEIIKSGLSLGYRFIDTGDVIDSNTTQIFKCLQNYKRKNLFISTRVYDYTTPEAFKEYLGNLNYIDLCNFGNVPITTSRMEFNNVALKIWAGMVILKNEGLVKHLGIINFHFRQAEIFFKLLKDKELELPTVAYVEVHPLNMQERLIQFYRKQQIHVIAYSPLGSNGHHIYSEHEIIDDIKTEFKADTYVQILLATTLARGISVIPKTLNNIHLGQNLASLQYISKVTQEHMDLLAEMDLNSPLNMDTTSAINANNRILN